jgi:hypothetical protein
MNEKSGVKCRPIRLGAIAQLGERRVRNAKVGVRSSLAPPNNVFITSMPLG